MHHQCSIFWSIQSAPSQKYQEGHYNKGSLPEVEGMKKLLQKTFGNIQHLFKK